MKYDRNLLSKTCMDNSIEFSELLEKKTIIFSCPKEPSDNLTEELLKIIPEGIVAQFVIGPSKATQMAIQILIKEAHFQGKAFNKNNILIVEPVKEMKDSFYQDMIKLIKSDNFFEGIRFILGDEEISYNKLVEREKILNTTERKVITQRDELTIRILNERDLDVLDFIKAISI